MVGKNEEPLVKQCRIKTDTLVRYKKEYNSYVKEVSQMEENVEKAKATEDPHEIKRWVIFLA